MRKSACFYAGELRFSGNHIPLQLLEAEHEKASASAHYAAGADAMVRVLTPVSLPNRQRLHGAPWPGEVRVDGVVPPEVDGEPPPLVFGPEILDENGRGGNVPDHGIAIRRRKRVECRSRDHVSKLHAVSPLHFACPAGIGGTLAGELIQPAPF